MMVSDILKAAGIGALTVTIAWVFWGFIVVMPRTGGGWSGQEVFILAPAFVMIGAFIGAIVGLVKSKLSS